MSADNSERIDYSPSAIREKIKDYLTTHHWDEVILLYPTSLFKLPIPNDTQLMELFLSYSGEFRGMVKNAIIHMLTIHHKNNFIRDDFAPLRIKIISLPTSNCPNYDIIQSAYPNVIVDPKSDIINRIRLITMVTSLPDYKIKPNSTNTEYDSVTNSFDYVMGKSRHVDDSCNQATITVNDYLFLLGDTINYMTNNCDESYTNADTIIQWSKKATTINHLDFRHYNYTAWLDYTIQNCTKQYGLCK